MLIEKISYASVKKPDPATIIALSYQLLSVPRELMREMLPDMIPSEFGVIDIGQSLLPGLNLRANAFADGRVVIDFKRRCHNILNHFACVHVRKRETVGGC